MYINVLNLQTKEEYNFILQPTFGLFNYELYWEQEEGIVIGNDLELPQEVWDIVQVIRIEYKRRPLKNGVREFGRFILRIDGDE